MVEDSIKLKFLDKVHKEIESKIKEICNKEMKVYLKNFGFTKEDLLLWLETSRCDFIISFYGSKMMYEYDLKQTKGNK